MVPSGHPGARQLQLEHPTHHLARVCLPRDADEDSSAEASSRDPAEIAIGTIRPPQNRGEPIHQHPRLLNKRFLVTRQGEDIDLIHHLTKLVGNFPGAVIIHEGAHMASIGDQTADNEGGFGNLSIFAIVAAIFAAIGGILGFMMQGPI